MDIKTNTMNKYSNVMCVACETQNLYNEERQEHIFTCNILMKGDKSETFSDIFTQKTHKIKYIVEIFFEDMKEREFFFVKPYNGPKLSLHLTDQLLLCSDPDPAASLLDLVWFKLSKHYSLEYEDFFGGFISSCCCFYIFNRSRLHIDRLIDTHKL